MTDYEKISNLIEEKFDKGIKDIKDVVQCHDVKIAKNKEQIDKWKGATAVLILLISTLGLGTILMSCIGY